MHRVETTSLEKQLGFDLGRYLAQLFSLINAFCQVNIIHF